MSFFTKDGSFINQYMFRPPNPAFYDECTFENSKNTLIWIPRDVETYNSAVPSLDLNMIPAILISPESRKTSPEQKILLIYFHANAEDIGLCEPTASILSDNLNCHVLVPEYPGYGLCPGVACESQVQQCALAVYDWVVSKKGLNWPASNLIICGRSIGSGPAVHVAAHGMPTPLSREHFRPPSNPLPCFNCRLTDVKFPLLQCILKAENIEFSVDDDIQALRKRILLNDIDVRDFPSTTDLINVDSLRGLLKNEGIPFRECAGRKELLDLAIRERSLPSPRFPHRCAVLLSV